MSTRGCIGVKTVTGFKGLYNHFDSYPEWMGPELCEHLAILFEKGILDLFPERLLRYDDWRNYLSNGKCEYCGQLGVGQAHGISAALLSDISELSGKTAAKGSYPDPECERHSHGDIPELVTETNADPLFIEWVYLIDVKTFKIDILYHHAVNGWHWEKDIKGGSYRSPNYSWSYVDTVNFLDKNINWKAVEDKGRRIKELVKNVVNENSRIEENVYITGCWDYARAIPGACMKTRNCQIKAKGLCVSVALPA